MPKIKIYSGLSLKREAIHKILPTAEVSAPVKRDDIYNDIKNGVHIIGIVDGEFLQNLSVSPTEILDALRCGVGVYGSSSMGAMRAAELAEFGMIGCGKIYEHIVSEPYFRDDKLGQIFYEASEQASLPFMDLQLGLARMKDQGKIASKEVRRLTEMYQDLHFTERTWAALAHRVRTQRDAASLLKALENANKNLISQKQTDGLALLKRISNDVKQHQVRLRLLSN